MSIMTSSGAFAAHTSVVAYPGGWTLAGVQDLNGDGKSDILWHYPPTGELYYYLMDGNAIQSARGGYNLPVGYTVRSLGDFNGDGRADVVSSNGQEVRMSLMTSTGAFAATATVVAYPAGWTLVPN